MKRMITWTLLVILSLGISAQELDSLKAILNHGDSHPNKEMGSGDTGTTTIYPVTVQDNGDEVNLKVGQKQVLQVVDKADSTYVKLGEKRPIVITDHPDSTRIRVGNKEISIVENNNRTDVHINRVPRTFPSGSRRFRGHWAGFEWGVNNFFDHGFSLSREGDAEFMDLNSGRSWNINLNFAQYSLGFGTSHVGLVTGMGFEFNNYFFDHANSIVEENDYAVSSPLDPQNLAKSKLTTTYLRVPLILEVQFPGTIRARRLYMSAGAVGGLKLGSRAKVVYKGSGGKDKSKDRDDFNINPFRVGLTARIGYGNLGLFGDYYFTPMFINGKGPELYPFSVGLSLGF